MNKIKTKKCPVCRRQFSYPVKKTKLISRRYTTCSKNCAKVYADCVKAYRYKLKVLEEK